MRAPYRRAINLHEARNQRAAAAANQRFPGVGCNSSIPKRRRWMDAYIAAGGEWVTRRPRGRLVCPPVKPCCPPTCLTPSSPLVVVHQRYRAVQKAYGTVIRMKRRAAEAYARQLPWEAAKVVSLHANVLSAIEELKQARKALGLALANVKPCCVTPLERRMFQQAVQFELRAVAASMDTVQYGASNRPRVRQALVVRGQRMLGELAKEDSYKPVKQTKQMRTRLALHRMKVNTLGGWRKVLADVAKLQHLRATGTPPQMSWRHAVKLRLRRWDRDAARFIRFATNADARHLKATGRRAAPSFLGCVAMALVQAKLMRSQWKKIYPKFHIVDDAPFTQTGKNKYKRPEIAREIAVWLNAAKSLGHPRNHQHVLVRPLPSPLQRDWRKQRPKRR